MSDAAVQPLERKAYTVQQAAEALGVSDQTIYDAVKRNELAAKWVGAPGSKKKRVVIPAAALDAWLAALPDEPE